jgi:hypothetical protein
MWVVYDPDTLEVYKCYHTQSQAKQHKKQMSKQLIGYWRKVEIDKFETGKLDSWLTWKALQQ